MGLHSLSLDSPSLGNRLLGEAAGLFRGFRKQRSGVGSVGISANFGEEGFDCLHGRCGEFAVLLQYTRDLRLYRPGKPSSAVRQCGREQGHADIVSTIDPDNLDVSEAISERWSGDMGSRRSVGGKNRITAGRDFNLHHPAFCGDETVRLLAPGQHVPLAVGDVNIKWLSLHDVAGIAESGDPNAKLCCAGTHDWLLC